MKEFIQSIRKCSLCEREFRNLNTESKPCLEAYEKWLPENIQCLFIAESPPSKDIYFYNCQKEDSLRKNLLALLGISESGCEGLCEFKQRGFFLTDSLKCRINKKNDKFRMDIKGDKSRKRIPTKVIQNCKSILKREIDLLSKQKGMKKVVVLGNTALKALKMVCFSELKNYRAARNCGKKIVSQGFEILIFVLPINRNSKYLGEKEGDLRNFVFD